jgi:hypothetical protein
LQEIDFDQPVGVVILSVLDVIDDSYDPFGITAQFRGRMVPGSYLGLSHLSAHTAENAREHSHMIGKKTGFPEVQFRSDAEVPTCGSTASTSAVPSEEISGVPQSLNGAREENSSEMNAARSGIGRLKRMAIGPPETLPPPSSEPDEVHPIALRSSIVDQLTISIHGHGTLLSPSDDPRRYLVAEEG